ncbi:GNAT family N-acetyltransferase [Haloferacaceae archaeon DSL9]
MYVRDARNRDEAWLLEHIEAMGLDDAAFRSRDYVIAVDEETDERVGFGRYRLHGEQTGEGTCELTGIGVLEPWRGQGVGAHVLERLIATVGDIGVETTYVLTNRGEYLEQFGFERIDPEGLPDPLGDRFDVERARLGEETRAYRLAVDEFEMPARLRDAFKDASPERPGQSTPEETAEDFGIDPETATYKYDTGR